jgi:hypothetical protein
MNLRAHMAFKALDTVSECQLLITFLPKMSQHNEMFGRNTLYGTD